MALFFLILVIENPRNTAGFLVVFSETKRKRTVIYTVETVAYFLLGTSSRQQESEQAKAAQEGER